MSVSFPSLQSPLPVAALRAHASRTVSTAVAALFCLASLALAGAAAAQTTGGQHTQTFVLQPGWNSIFVEVDPHPFDFDQVFHGLPVQSVWAWYPPVGAVDFITNPNVGLSNPGWRGWFPRPNPDAFLSQVFALEANRAYLVNMGGDQPVEISITGRPVNLDVKWTPDSFNFVGFHLDPANPPNFGSFFLGSQAHLNTAFYRLKPEGVWEQVPAPFSTHMRSGEAYWIFSHGPSTFQGPLEVETELFDGMEYSAALDEQRLVIRNTGIATHEITVRSLSSDTPIPFLERSFNETGAEIFSDLPPTSAHTVTSGQGLFLQIGVRRSELAHDRSEQLLEITDGLGSRRLIFAGVSRVHPESPLPLVDGRPGTGPSGFTGADPYAGLWLGAVAITGVSEVQSADDSPTPVAEPFRFRILIHVDAAGQVRLLKEVIQMWKEGTTKPDSEFPDLSVVDEPGRFVLLTDPSLIPDYEGAAMRDGVPVGLRISTVAYDFFEPDDTELVLNGAMAPDGQLTTALYVNRDGPTNPFKHTYHPDHDNLDAQFLNPANEAYGLLRFLTLTFSPDHPTDRPPAGWGSNRLGAVYEEEIYGLHRKAITVEGLVLFTRIAATAQLNG